MGAENLIPVEIPVPPEVAERLRALPTADMDRLRVLLQVFVSTVVPPHEALQHFLDDLGPKLRERGLTDDIVDAELAAYNAERRC